MVRAMRGSSLSRIGAAAAILLSSAAVAVVFLVSSAAVAVAQQTRIVPGQAQADSPTCKRLVGQLSALDRGNADPTRAGQIRQAEDAVNKQQYVVDQLVSRSRRMGCENTGFFSIFSNRPQACDALSQRIDQQRNTLDGLQNQLEQLNGGNTPRGAKR